MLGKPYVVSWNSAEHNSHCHEEHIEDHKIGWS